MTLESILKDQLNEQLEKEPKVEIEKLKKKVQELEARINKMDNHIDRLVTMNEKLITGVSLFGKGI